MTQRFDLVRADDRVMNVRTGELLDLREAPADDLAEAREGLVALRHEIDEANVLLDAELVARIDTAIRTGEIDRYTVRIGPYEVKVPSPEAGGVVDAGALQRRAVEACREARPRARRRSRTPSRRRPRTR